jgi:MFS transporter, BCD family, chlorophyll transporter
MTNNQPDLNSDLEIANFAPNLKLITMFRLGLFQMGLGIMSLLTLGLLNRVMINELAIPSTLVAVMVAIPLFMSPARVWFGQMSDTKKIWGYHRTGYVWLGSASFSLCAFFVALVMWQFGLSLHNLGWQFSTYAWAGLLGLMFALYGLALSASSTPFAALLVDISDEAERSKLVGIVWSMLMIGIVIGAITISKLLPCNEGVVNTTSIFTRPEQLATLQASINRIFVLIPVVVLSLSAIATFGIEKKYSRYASRLSEIETIEREDKITFARAFRILTASRQTGIFFSFLLLMTISIFMQDAILEPYGGEVFGMSICKTTQLNAFFGTGTLVGISMGGFFVAPRIGKQRTTQFGCIACIFCFGLLILSGLTANPNVLKASMLIFGLASGVATTGAVSLMLDLTAVATAGTFIGAWGLSQAIARGLATVIGGAVLDIGRHLFSFNVFAYGGVFCLQAVCMIVAVGLLRRVNVQEFQMSAKQAIVNVIAGDLD